MTPVAAVLYHCVRAEDDGVAAQYAIIEIVNANLAEGRDIVGLYVDIEGHRNVDGGYDIYTGFIKEFLLMFLGQYIPTVSISGFGCFKNPSPLPMPESFVLMDEQVVDGEHRRTGGEPS